LNILRTITTTGTAPLAMAGQYDQVADAFKNPFPERLHERLLYVFRVDGLFYRKRLLPEERERLEEVYRRHGEALRQSGVEAQVIGEKYEETDYVDRSHLSESGGRKLAADLAPTIRAMNARLYGASTGVAPTAAEGAKP
jgi:hypothetical protein